MKRRAAIALIFLLVALVGFWSFSYFRYGLIAREAYSGIGTELMSIQGKLIFWKYNSYQNGPPPQEWIMTAFPPDSKMGRRMEAEYDFTMGPKLRYSGEDYGPNTFNLIVILPYWLLVLVVSLLLGVIVVRSREMEN